MNKYGVLRTCPRCDGGGHVEIEIVSREERYYGTAGRIPVYKTITCPLCDGDGQAIKITGEWNE